MTFKSLHLFRHSDEEKNHPYCGGRFSSMTVLTSCPCTSAFSELHSPIGLLWDFSITSLMSRTSQLKNWHVLTFNYTKFHHVCCRRQIGSVRYWSCFWHSLYVLLPTPIWAVDDSSWKIVYARFQAAYKIFRYPLHRFPGLKSVAATTLPYVLASSGYFANSLHKLHEKHGAVVTTAPNELSFIDPSAWPTILSLTLNRCQNPFRKHYDSFNETRSPNGPISSERGGSRSSKETSESCILAGSTSCTGTIIARARGRCRGLQSEVDVGLVDLEECLTSRSILLETHPLENLQLRRTTEPSGMATYAAQGKKDHHNYQWTEDDCTVSYVLLGTSVSEVSLQRTVLQSVVNRLNFDLQKIETRIASEPNRGDVLFTLTLDQPGKEDP